MAVISRVPTVFFYVLTASRLFDPMQRRQAFAVSVGLSASFLLTILSRTPTRPIQTMSVETAGLNILTALSRSTPLSRTKMFGEGVLEVVPGARNVWNEVQHATGA